MNTPSIFTRTVAFTGSVLVTLTMVAVTANYAIPETTHTQLAAAQTVASNPR